MKLEFHKYHGAGNDFIIIDNRSIKLELTKSQISLICNRHFGAGADGLMMLQESNNFDFSMRYFNADGGEASMCGNGGRCIVAFANNIGIINNNTIFEAIDGIHKGKINSKNNTIFDISIKMIDVDYIENNGETFFLNTGVPHHISFVEKVENINIAIEGKEIRHSEKYENMGGTNVNFVEETHNGLKIRTYERGVEGETLACGTGATAAAIAFAIKNNTFDKEIILQAAGGKLRVKFDSDNNKFSNIILSGPAEYKYYGQWEAEL